MADPTDDRAVTAAQRAVDEPAGRVLEDRYTEDGAGGGGGGDGGGAGGGGGTTAAPVLRSPFPWPIDPGFQEAPRDHPLRKALSALTAREPFKKMRFALADMTTDKRRPVYVGYRDRDQVFVASMAKLAMLLPVFMLREAARDAADKLEAKNPADFLKKLGKAWEPEIRKYFRAKGKNSFPNLAKILTVTRARPTDPFVVEFNQSPPNDPTQASFLLDLRLGLQWGGNAQAASTIGLLGYPYINGVNQSAGLSAKGIFMARNYAPNDVWDPGYAGSGQEATARAVAELLTLVTQDRMAAPGLFPEVRDVMWWTGADPALESMSDLTKGIRKRLEERERVTLIGQGKVGYLDEGPFADSAIILRAAGTLRLRYVAVVLSAASHQQVEQAGVALDDCILIANGLPPKPVPPPP